jgi:glycerol-3-phosphate dehydrogenase
MKEFSIKTRAENIQRLQKEEFDLCIIGGGITGAGTARDAALRGMKVALIEADDFASGTSSRSSKLVHGGIRYLENYEFKLVFEALSERQKLFKIAPHLVHPLRFVIPLYKSGRVGMFKMGLGMWAYDALSLFQAPELHERLDRDESLQRLPSLQGKELLGSYVYSDAYMDDARLVHETLRSANEAGALAANYVRATGAKFDENKKMRKIVCRDDVGKKEFEISARHFVSSVGPWTDELGENLFHQWKKILRPTKGVHLTFKKERLPLAEAVVMGAESRIVFGIPRHEMVIVGTTDTDYQGDPKEVRTTEEDVRYLLGVIDQYFPGAKIKASDIVASYEGVRPLVADHAESEGKTSREHVIFTEEHGVTFVAGGKYTTYRLMAEQVVDQCLHHFPIEDRVRFNNCLTEQPLNHWVTEESRIEDHLTREQIMERIRGWPAQVAALFTTEDVDLLLDRHGREALEIVQDFAGLGYWEMEAAHAIDKTMCFHLVDFYSRRVPLFLAETDHGLSVLEKISRIFARHLDWSPAQLAEEKKSLDEYIQTELAWRQKVF